jgi:hypothetical protein
LIFFRHITETHQIHLSISNPQYLIVAKEI